MFSPSSLSTQLVSGSSWYLIPTETDLEQKCVRIMSETQVNAWGEGEGREQDVSAQTATLHHSFVRNFHPTLQPQHGHSPSPPPLLYVA